MAPKTCAQCGTSTDTAAICSRCKQVWYCDAKCQRAHWKAHKAKCVAPAAAVERAIAAPAPVQSQPVAIKPPTANKPSKAVDASLSALLGGGGAAAAAGSKPAAAKSASGAAPVAVTFSLPAESAQPEHPLLEVRELPGRGRGFVALQAIEPGTLLLTESSIYARAAHCNSNEESRIAALAGLTRVMHERYPAALEKLCHHPDHELPSHPLVDQSPLPSLSVEQWHAALARVDSNCFTSSRGMMCSPTVSIANHSCYPNADLIIREVVAPAKTSDADATAAAATVDSAAAPASTADVVEQCYLYAIEPIAAGDEVRINYLGQDSLCRWYAPAMLRQESFESQWQFRCDCLRCEGPKARAIDKTIAYAADGLSEELEERYAKLVLAEHESGAPNPHQLLQLYRDIFATFDGERFYHNYLLHQIRTMLLFMPAAFDGTQQQQVSKGKSAASSSSSGASSGPRGEAEWLQLVEHHLLSLRNNLLNPPLHSIKADTLAVVLRSSDFIGDTVVENEPRARQGLPPAANQALRRRVVELAQEHDEAYFDTPAFAQLYPDVFSSLQQALAQQPAAAASS